MKEIKSRKKIFVLSLQILLACACFYYIVVSFEWSEIWLVLGKANWLLFSSSATISLCLYWLLRSMRWSLLLRHENLHISFLKIYLYTAMSAGFAVFTPFQSGEALKVEFFRKYGGGRVSGYTFFLIEKLCDFFALGLLALVGILTFFVFSDNGNVRLLIISFSILLAIVTGTILLFAGRIQRKLPFLQNITFPDTVTLVIVLFLTLLGWTVLIAGWKFIFQSIALDLSIRQTVSVVSLTTIISILSLIPAAVGISEVTIAALLKQMGFARSIAESGALMMGIYSLLILFLSVIHLVILNILGFNQNRLKKDLEETKKFIKIETATEKPTSVEPPVL